MSKIDFALLQQYRDNGLITIRKHPDGDLYIHNYTPTVQYKRLWDDVTRLCRGLITDGQGNIKARGFRKFFNAGEHSVEELMELEGKPHTITLKMDGSLAISYVAPDGKIALATRGSFVSEQAKWATAYLRKNFPKFCDNPKLHLNHNYLFEIIYPDNKIVVDYGQREDLVLLAQVEREHGLEMPYETLEQFASIFGFTMVPRYIGDWKSLPTHLPNEEGFVVMFPHTVPPTRIKYKLEDYIRLHRLAFQTTEHGIWECLKDGVGLDMFLENVPDEFYGWVRKVEARLRGELEGIKLTCELDFKVLDTRKDTALYFQTCAYPSVLFAMLDGKPVERIIWKMLEPANNLRYTKEEE